MSVFNFSLPLVTAALVCSHTASATLFRGDVIQRQWPNSQNLFSNLKSCNDKIISAPGTRRVQSKYMTNNVCHWGGEDKCKSISNEEFTRDTTGNNHTINTTNKIKEITIRLKKTNGAKNKTKAQSIYKKPNKFYTSREERGLLPFKKTLSEPERQNAPYTLVKKDSLDLAKQDIYVPAKDWKLCIKTFSKKSPSPSQQNIEKWTKDVNTAYRESSEYVKNSITGSNFRDYLDELSKKTERIKSNITSALFYIKDKSKSISLPRTAERKELLTKCNFIRRQVLEAPDITPVQNLSSICKHANIYNTFVRKLDKAKIESRPLEDVLNERIVFKSKPLKRTFIWPQLYKILDVYQQLKKVARKVLSSQNTYWTMDKKIDYLIWLIWLRKFDKKLAKLLDYYHGPKIKISERPKQNIKYLAYKEGAAKTRKNNKAISHDNFSTKDTLASATKSKNQFCDSSYNTFKTTRTPYVKKSAKNVASEYTKYTMIYILPAK